MSFLSIEQREAGRAQLAEHMRLVEDDIAALRMETYNRNEYRRRIRDEIYKLDRAICGTAADADELLDTDQRTVERMRGGILHYPVRVVRGDAVRVLAAGTR